MRRIMGKVFAAICATAIGALAVIHVANVAKADATTDTLQQLLQNAITESYGPATLEMNVYISGNYAAVGYTADVMGGVKFFSNTSGQWQIIGGGGGAPVTSEAEDLGIPASNAQNLIDQIYGATPSVDCVPDGYSNCVAHTIVTSNSSQQCTVYVLGRPHTITQTFSTTTYQIRTINGTLQEFIATTSDAGNGDCSMVTTWDPGEPSAVLGDPNLP